MIHIKNKKKPLEVTVEEMRKFSLSYLGKYAPSKQQLKTYLLKKYLNKTALNIKKQDITNLIDIVLSDLQKTKRPKETCVLIEIPLFNAANKSKKLNSKRKLD